MLQQLQPMVSAKVAALEAEATAKNCKWVSKGRGGGGGVTGREWGLLPLWQRGRCVRSWATAW